jgi:hypothetical protein
MKISREAVGNPVLGSSNMLGVVAGVEGDQVSRVPSRDGIVNWRGSGVMVAFVEPACCGGAVPEAQDARMMALVVL